MRISILLFVLLLTVSCKQEREKSYVGIAQDSVISREQMINMLVDVHLIEATLQVEANKGIDVKKLSLIYYSAIFSKYKISERRFKSSIDYFKQDQGEFIKIYDEVIAELNKRAANLKATSPEVEPE